MSDVVSEPAAAKINLFLRVLRRRTDGFHDIQSIVQPVTLADGIRAESARELSLAVVGDAAEGVPTDESNLVVRGARALGARCGADGGARILLVKRIPVAAGLGGGSADAAAALRALNDLWGCGLSRRDLADIATEIGSDVPALVHGGPVLMRGRGDDVEPVEVPKTWWALLPASGVSSRDAYAWWDADGGEPGPDPSLLLEALRSGDLDAVARYLFNDLEAPVSERRSEIARAREALLEAGAIGTVMCGSGPSVAGLARDGAHADEIARASGGTAVSSLSR